ncbi:STAS domain-containing protein [Kitasatospora paranensis]|uniref:Anti-sigma factor antagonist n=1 Tax=Kitasatospora paranensis TaxID=258053 RepID=A0ABW2FZ80_9ACTN
MAERPAPPGHLTVAVTVHAAVAHLHVSGELDMDTAPEIDSAVGVALLGRPRIVILDAATLSFCDCVGLGTLLRAGRRVSGTGATFHLEGPSPQLLRLAALTGTSDALGLPAPCGEDGIPGPRVHTPAVGAGR